MRGKIEKWDSYEMRTSLIFFWLFFILLLAAVIASRNPEWGFAVFTLVAGSVVSFFTALWWLVMAFASSKFAR
jgi:hypothetical protein